MVSIRCSVLCTSVKTVILCPYVNKLKCLFHAHFIKYIATLLIVVDWLNAYTLMELASVRTYLYTLLIWRHSSCPNPGALPTWENAHMHILFWLWIAAGPSSNHGSVMVFRMPSLKSKVIITGDFTKHFCPVVKNNYIIVFEGKKCWEMDQTRSSKNLFLR